MGMWDNGKWQDPKELQSNCQICKDKWTSQYFTNIFSNFHPIELILSFKYFPGRGRQNNVMFIYVNKFHHFGKGDTID